MTNNYVGFYSAEAVRKVKVNENVYVNSAGEEVICTAIFEAGHDMEYYTDLYRWNDAVYKGPVVSWKRVL